MHSQHAPSPPPHERSLARDRAVLALAAALCGAIAAAGVAAVALASQLHTRQQQRSMRSATEALEIATQSLVAAREELAETRAAAATCAAPKAPLLGPRTITAGSPGGATMITHVGVSCPEEHVCQVHREVITAALADSESLVRSARVIPMIRGGEHHGFKLYGIRSGSLLRLLGFRNGDRLDAIDGLPLRSLDQLVGAFVALRSGGPVIRVDVERKGEVIQRRFEIL